MSAKSFLIDYSRKDIQESYILSEDFSGSKSFTPIFLIALTLSLLFQLFIIFFPAAFDSDNPWLQVSSSALNVDIEFIRKREVKNTQSNESIPKQLSESLVDPIMSSINQSEQGSVLKADVNKVIDISPDSISQAATNILPEYKQNGSEGVRIVPQYRRDPGAIETIRVSSGVEIVRRGDRCFTVREPEPSERRRGKIWSMPYFCGEPQSKKFMENVQQGFCNRYGCDGH